MDKNSLIKFVRCVKCFSQELQSVGDFAQCSSCGGKYLYKDGKIFFSEVPSDAKMHDEAKKFDRVFSVQRKGAIDYFKRILEKEDSSKIFCDIGVGTDRLQDLKDKFHTKIGLDFVPYSAVSIVADFTKPLPLRDNSVDIVFITEVLEHIPTPPLLISEIYRILKPNGFCLGSVPFLHPIHSAPYDFYRYTNFALDKLFHEGGFKDVEVKNIGRPFDVYSVFQKSFFNVYAVNVKYSSNIFANSFFTLSVRISRKLQDFLNKLLSPLYERIPEADNYVLGYCFKAQK